MKRAPRLLAIATGALAILALAATLGLSQLVLHPLAGPRDGGGPPPRGFVPLDVPGTPRLSCWLGLPPGPTPGTAIFVHGLGASREQGRRLGAALLDRGLAVLLCDLRGHGGSEDGPLSYGPLEAGDLRRALDAAALLGAPPDRKVLVGYSLGGAVAAQLAHGDPAARALVLVSTFTSVREILRHYGAWAFGGVPGPVVDAALLAASLRAGFAVDEPSTLEVVRGAAVPVLLVHGARDVQIPFAMHERLCAASEGRARCVRVERAEHVDLFEVGGAALEARIADFAAEAVSR